MKLEPITDETNIKGNTAYVKVTLEGQKDKYGDILTTTTITVHKGEDQLNEEPFCSNTVFVISNDSDTSRLFKKGDRVQAVQQYRGGITGLEHSQYYTVIQDEEAGFPIAIQDMKGECLHAPSVALDLVMSLEDLKKHEPYYFVSSDCTSYTVICKHGELAALNTFIWKHYGKENAEILATHCCELLNKQHKQKIDSE